MMTRPRRLLAPLAWTLALGLAGCHIPADRLMGSPQRLNAGGAGMAQPKADTAGTAPPGFYTAVHATLAALDELHVRPEALTVENGVRADRPLRSGDLAGAASNAGLLPADQAATRAIFEDHRLPSARPDAPPTPFIPVAIDYRGQAPDGRPVAVVVRAPAQDSPGFDLTARIGPDGAGDEAWSRGFLDKVAANLAAAAPASVAPAPGAK